MLRSRGSALRSHHCLATLIAVSCNSVIPWSWYSAQNYHTESETYYDVLGVSKISSTETIKAAFRTRAKRLHPDVKAGREADHAAFLQLLTAYEVLSNDRERQLYDLSLDVNAGRTAKEAAAGAEMPRRAHAPPHPSRRRAGEEGSEWLRGGEGGWREWVAGAAEQQPRQARRTEVDRLRAELRADFRSALRHAYLGPELELGAGQLPPAFEAEERSSPGLGVNLLHLVSGRTLLGVVRERPTRALPGHGADNFPSTLDQAPSAATLDDPSRPCDGGGGSASDRGEAGACGGGSRQCGSDEGAAGAGTWQPDWAPQQEGAQTLELLIDGELVAVAVRQKGGPGAHAAAPAGRAERAGTVVGSERLGQGAMAVYAADGRLLAEEREGTLRVPGRAAAVHVVRIATPLVRHLYFVAKTGKKRLILCRCHKAWLPPSFTWLFPPRSPLHARGGFYFEWAGHKDESHPLWLHPAIFVLTAAYDSLDAEHSRLGREGARDRGEGADWTAAGQTAHTERWGLKQWAQHMLSFHGWR